VSTAGPVPGDLILGCRGLARVHRVGKLAGATGVWILDGTGDPGSLSGHPVFVPGWCVQLPVIGQTVCPQPRPHDCALRHLTAGELARLPKARYDPTG
jgi:hypothetical protein